MASAENKRLSPKASRRLFTETGEPSYTWTNYVTQSTEAHPCGRSKHAVCTYREYLYLYAGKNGNLAYRDLWRYNIVTDEWKKLTCSGYEPPSLQGHSLLAYKSKLYVFGGLFNCGADCDVPLWNLDLETLEWSKIKGMIDVMTPCSRRGHSALIHKGAMHIYGGYVDLKGSTGQLWTFNFEPEMWQLSYNSGLYSDRGPGPRHGHSAVLHDGCMWLLAGMTDLLAHDDLWRWSFSLRVWMKIKCKPGPPPMSGHTACKLGLRMLAFGGSHNGHLLNDLWAFHFQTLTWQKIQYSSGLQPCSRTMHCAVSVEPLLLENTRGQTERSQSTPLLKKQIIIDDPVRPMSSPPMGVEQVPTPNRRNRITPTGTPSGGGLDSGNGAIFPPLQSFTFYRSPAEAKTPKEKGIDDKESQNRLYPSRDTSIMDHSRCSHFARMEHFSNPSHPTSNKVAVEMALRKTKTDVYLPSECSFNVSKQCGTHQQCMDISPGQPRVSGMTSEARDVPVDHNDVSDLDVSFNTRPCHIDNRKCNLINVGSYSNTNHHRYGIQNSASNASNTTRQTSLASYRARHDSDCSQDSQASLLPRARPYYRQSSLNSLLGVDNPNYQHDNLKDSLRCLDDSEADHSVPKKKHKSNGISVSCLQSRSVSEENVFSTHRRILDSSPDFPAHFASYLQSDSLDSVLTDLGGVRLKCRTELFEASGKAIESSTQSDLILEDIEDISDQNASPFHGDKSLMTTNCKTCFISDSLQSDTHHALRPVYNDPVQSDNSGVDYFNCISESPGSSANHHTRCIHSQNCQFQVDRLILGDHSKGYKSCDTVITRDQQGRPSWIFEPTREMSPSSGFHQRDQNQDILSITHDCNQSSCDVHSVLGQSSMVRFMGEREQNATRGRSLLSCTATGINSEQSHQFSNTLLDSNTVDCGCNQEFRPGKVRYAWQSPDKQPALSDTCHSCNDTTKLFHTHDTITASRPGHLSLYHFRADTCDDNVDQSPSYVNPAFGSQSSCRDTAAYCSELLSRDLTVEPDIRVEPSEKTKKREERQSGAVSKTRKDYEQFCMIILGGRDDRPQNLAIEPLSMWKLHVQIKAAAPLR